MRLLLTLITIFSFLAILASGAYYGYGYGIEIFQQAVDDAQAQLNESAPMGTQATIDKFYYEKNFQSIAVKYHIGDELGVIDEVSYATILIPSMEVNETAYSELTFPDESYEELPAMLLTDDGDAVKTQAITYAIISLSMFVGSILVKSIFFKKQ